MPAKPRKKPPPQTTSDFLSMLETAIRQFAYGHHIFTVFRHFVELSALVFSNVADPINKATREKQYLAIGAQYKPEEFAQFPPLLGMLATCLEHELTDVLGRLYHRLEIHNHQAGQFFTPYPVCLAMAKMLVHDAKHLVQEQEFIRAMEPCVGSGAMVIALAQALRGYPETMLGKTVYVLNSSLNLSLFVEDQNGPSTSQILPSWPDWQSWGLTLPV